MRNVKIETAGNVLTITVNLADKGKPSQSGKTTVIASTEGNVPIPGKDAIKIGLNIYKSR